MRFMQSESVLQTKNQSEPAKNLCLTWLLFPCVFCSPASEESNVIKLWVICICFLSFAFFVQKYIK